MILLLTHDNTTSAIECACDESFAISMAMQAKWLITNLTAGNNVSYNDIKEHVPAISANSIQRIQDILREQMPAAKQFVTICNELATAPVFTLAYATTFELTNRKDGQ